MLDLVAGLDLGQASDFTAIAILEVVHAPLEYEEVREFRETVERRPAWGSWPAVYDTVVVRRVLKDGEWVDPLTLPRADPTFAVRHLARWPLGTSYPKIVQDVADMMARPPLNNEARLVVDGTGVGRAVIDLLHEIPDRQFGFQAITITGGEAVTHEGGYTRIPKRDLVQATLVALQQKRLQFPDPAKLPAVTILQAELASFRYKINPRTAHDSYGAWREGEHDDLLLALCLAVWEASKQAPTFSWIDV